MATAYHMEALRRQRVLERAAEAKERMQETEVASARAEEKREKEKRKQHRHYHHKRSNRPASAQKISSSPKKSKTAHSLSPSVSEKADKMETSPPSPQGGKSSRSSTASKSVNGLQSSGSLHSSNKPGSRDRCHSDSTTATTAEQSRACSSNGEAVSGGTETIIVSRCSKCRSVVSSTSSQPYYVQGQQSRSASNRSSAVGGGRARGAKSATSVRSGSTRASSTLASERGRSLEKIVELKADAVRKDLHQQELLLRDSNLVMGNIPMDEEMKLRALEQQKLDLTA